MSSASNVSDRAGFSRVGVIGGGAWGTALAQVARAAGRDTVLWAREPEVAQAINTQHENTLFLPGVPLDPALRATARQSDLADREVLLLVAPAQHLGAVCHGLAAIFPAGIPVVNCAKGIEAGSLRLMHAVVAHAWPQAPRAILSGPTFAAEVARGQPTAVTLACEDRALGGRLVETLGSRTFRPYPTDDVVGAQIGGAVKNVLAIACGIVEGLGLGHNARAALVTRGLAEMERLAVTLGGRAETLRGLSGLGDLTLTCNSRQSRNMALGLALGQGASLAELMRDRRSVAEGVHTAAAVAALAAREKVDMPICHAVHAIIDEGAEIAAIVAALLSRPFRNEF